MQEKTIRFEKGKVYRIDVVNQYKDIYIDKNKYFRHRADKAGLSTVYYECIKSFTVQINIIEDEES